MTEKLLKKILKLTPKTLPNKVIELEQLISSIQELLVYLDVKITFQIESVSKYINSKLVKNISNYQFSDKTVNKMYYSINNLQLNVRHLNMLEDFSTRKLKKNENNDDASDSDNDDASNSDNDYASNSDNKDTSDDQNE